jgi:hypothetical protein
MPYNGELAI